MARRIKYTDAKYRVKESDMGGTYRRMTYDVMIGATEKQAKLIKDLKQICADVGIDLTGLKFSVRDRTNARSTIRALYSILERHGYDGHGNPLSRK